MNRSARLDGPLIGLVLVLLIAALARFHWLDHQSLWNDEGNSLRLAQRSAGDLIDAAGRDIHPPGYYLVLKLWIGLAGESEFGLRSLSALQGLLAVAVTAALGQTLFKRAFFKRVLFGRWAGLLAALIVALNPFAVYYSQETRMYAQLGLLSAASMWVLVVWLGNLPQTVERRGGFRNPPLQKEPATSKQKQWQRYGPALSLALINAAGLYTQYSYPFTMLAQGVLVAVWLIGRRDRRALVEYVLLNVLTLLLFLPWLPTAWDQVTNWPGSDTDLALGEQLRAVLTWITYGSTAGRVAWGLLIVPGLLVLAALVPVGRPDSRAHPLPLVWAALVIAGLFVSGAYREANLKFLLPAQIAAALVIGAGAEKLVFYRRGRRERREKQQYQKVVLPALGAAGLIVVLGGQVVALDALYTDPAYARDDYRAIARQITADARPGDAIILDAPNQVEVFSYYYHASAPVYELPRGLGGDDEQTRAEVEAVIADHRRIYVLFWGEDQRDPRRVVQSTLDTGAYPVVEQWVGDVRLATYVVLGEPPAAPQVPTAARFGDSISLAGYALSAETPQRGDVLGLTLFWETDSPLDVRYKVTVQLLGPDGRLIAQHDAEPGSGRALTTTWAPGTPVIDTHGLVIPADLPPGAYTVILSLYEIDPPYTRLPVSVDSAAVGDTLTLLALDLP